MHNKEYTYKSMQCDASHINLCTKGKAWKEMQPHDLDSACPWRRGGLEEFAFLQQAGERLIGWESRWRDADRLNIFH